MSRRLRFGITANLWVGLVIGQAFVSGSRASRFLVAERPSDASAEPPQSRSRREPMETEQQQKLDALIGKRVIDTLGKPGGLHKVQVRRLWDDHYRVNVLIGEDAASAKIANSYFLEADSDGNIVRSTPKITKQY
jgi:hypothetical protein